MPGPNSFPNRAPGQQPHLVSQFGGGLVIVGTGRACGKTTLTAGLAASLMDIGIKLSALHPLAFSEQPHALEEQAFLDEVSGAYTHHEALSVPSPKHLSVSLWQKVLGQIRRAPYPPLVDTPASLVTPLYEPPRQDNPETPPWIDPVGLAQSLLLPILLVAQSADDLFAEAMPVLAYLANYPYGHHHTVGWVTVETRKLEIRKMEPDPNGSSQARQIHQISQWTRLPHLGTLPYDPALSVSHKTPGQLIELAQNHLDLLPVQQAFRAYV